MLHQLGFLLFGVELLVSRVGFQVFVDFIDLRQKLVFLRNFGFLSLVWLELFFFHLLNKLLNLVQLLGAVADLLPEALLELAEFGKSDFGLRCAFLGLGSFLGLRVG